jgi:hypothetical protein
MHIWLGDINEMCLHGLNISSTQDSIFSHDLAAAAGHDCRGDLDSEKAGSDSKKAGSIPLEKALFNLY